MWVDFTLAPRQVLPGTIVGSGAAGGKVEKAKIPENAANFSPFS